MLRGLKMGNGLNSKKTGMSTKKKEKLFFYCVMVTLPLIQFAVFYIYVNIQSFVLAFQKYSNETFTYSFAGLTNFIQIFKDFRTTQELQASIVNSLTLYIWTLLFGALLAVFFSYYIYKKNVGSMAFKILLYLPQILGGVVVVVMYKFFLEDCIPAIYSMIFKKSIPGLLTNPQTERAMIIFFSIYVGFGTRILVYSSAMSGIPDSIIESAQLDGVTPFKELVFIVIPSIWGTFVTFMVSSIMAIFTDQMSLFTFYGQDASPHLYTFGYYLYRGAKVAKNVDYPYLSAMGMMLTLIVTPMTLFARWAMNKYGPSKE